jgi:predicted NAD/FAD-dependent oxidoreductase
MCGSVHEGGIMVTCAIIGAGVAGLAAARIVRQRMPEVVLTVYEKSRGLGGRVATRRRNGCVFDHGAQVIKAPDERTRQVLHHELADAALVEITAPVWTFDAAGRLSVGDPALAERQWAYRDGLSRLGKRLAGDTAVVREVRIAALMRQGTRWALHDDAGTLVGEADAVLLTPPAPQTSAILAQSQLDPVLRERLITALAPAQYRRCISVALGYARRFDPPWYAAVNADRQHPIVWLGLEHRKDPTRAPADQSLLVAQLAPAASLAWWDMPLAELVAQLGPLVTALLADDPGAPLWADRQGWRYALPDGAADAATLASARDHGLWFAGDFLTGVGRIHRAIASGEATGAALVAALGG